MPKNEKTEKEYRQNLLSLKTRIQIFLYILKLARACDDIIRFLNISEITREQHKEISLILKRFVFIH